LNRRSDAPMGLRKNRGWGLARGLPRACAPWLLSDAPGGATEKKEKNLGCGSTRSTGFTRGYTPSCLRHSQGIDNLDKGIETLSGDTAQFCARRAAVSFRPDGAAECNRGWSAAQPVETRRARRSRFMCLSFRPGGAAESPEANQVRRTRHASPLRTVPSPLRGERKPGTRALRGPRVSAGGDTILFIPCCRGPGYGFLRRPDGATEKQRLGRGAGGLPRACAAWLLSDAPGGAEATACRPSHTAARQATMAFTRASSGACGL